MSYKILIIFFGCLLYAASLSGQSYEIADSLWNLALEAEKDSNWQKAAELWGQSSLAEKACSKPRQINLYYYTRNASYDWHQAGNMEKAFLFREESYSIVQKVSSPDDVEIAVAASWLGWYYVERGEYNNAEPLYIESLAIVGKALGNEHSEYGIRLNNLAELYTKMGQYDKALSLFLQALAMYEKSLGKDHAFYSLLLNNLAELYRTIGKYENALPIYLDALSITEKSLGKEHPNYVLSLGNLAMLYQTIGQYDKALPLYQEAVENTEITLGKGHPEYSLRLGNLAELYRTMGQYEKALPLYLEALSITEKSLGKENPNYGLQINNLGLLYQVLGQYEKALPLYLEAQVNTENALGKEHSRYGVCLSNLAELYSAMGQYDKSLPLFLEALENAEKSLGKEHSQYGHILSNLALLYHSIGKYEKALPLYLGALANCKKALGIEHHSYSISLINLASFYENLGQYDKALNLFLEALDYTEIALGKEHSQYGISLRNLAGIYRTLGQNGKALQLYLEALDNIDKALGKVHTEYNTCLNDLAELYSEIGQYDKAQPLYLEVLTNTEKNLGKEHPSYGTSLNNLASFYKSMGQYEKALPLYLESIANAEKSLGKEHGSYDTPLSNLALLYELMGKYEKALPLHLEGLHNLKLQIQQNFGFLSEKEKEQFVNTEFFKFHMYQSFLTNYPTKGSKVSGFAQDIELTRKGLLLQSSVAMRQAVLQSGDTALLSQFDDWSFTKSIIAKQYAIPLNERRTDLNELESKAEQMEAALTRKSSAMEGALQVGQIQWQQVRDALPEKAAAIEFVSFRYRSAEGWTDSTLYMALVLRHGDTMPHMIPLFEQRQLDSLTKKKGGDESFVSSLYRDVKLNLKETEKVQYGKRLFELVWKRLDSLLEPGYDVYLSPSGTLNQLAFAAIPYDTVSTLSDHYRLHTLGSTAALLKPANNKKPNSITIYGGVSYDEADTVNSVNSTTVSRSLPGDLPRGGETWSYLEGSMREAESIAGAASKKGIQAKLLTGKEATEEILKAQTGSKAPDILHIATHGFFFPDPQTVRKEQDGFLTGQQESVFKASDNPLNRSGILLAGANKTWAGASAAEGREDGILTAYEASYLQLANTKLVVLSACETGLGTIRGSEGVYGLQRAFKQAGAEYLLISLWKVPDDETAEFMAIFYSQYFGGNTVEEAYHLTQKAMREKYRNDPYKWAAFVLVR